MTTATGPRKGAKGCEPDERGGDAAAPRSGVLGKDLAEGRG